ncbi:1-acyl-sn-glycerol-3-phosphate acyltransferase [Acidipropionibacterium jensenii]|uniref:lysophospholipid acyltransferase family protein n=1 Tax=Acidipropionibacterium jensenii TaxID=1749 RepID=UPI000BC35D32|nr:lysophospholipid acyltransferase family protein [Acidipropionibacterium jensenii]AZZ43028.1 1-acyl-sn-glycerol-3-phosphate acyltransferase [Acidipropionibacterium jensenii]
MPIKPKVKDRGRYTSDINAVARQAANMLLLKPLVWRVTRVTVHGLENLGGLDGAYVITANHSSHLDTPLIFGSLPKRLSRYLSTGAAADYFFTNWWRAFTPVLFFNAFPVDRGKGRTRSGSAPHTHRGLAGSLLTDGIPLLIFAEGTRSRTGGMGTFKPGAAALAISRGVPVIPVALVGAFSAMPSDLQGLPKGRPPVHVVYGHPMQPAPGEIAHEFSERIRRQIITLHDQTARAYGMPTQADYARTLALGKAADKAEKAEKAEKAAAEKASTEKGDQRPPEPPSAG